MDKENVDYIHMYATQPLKKNEIFPYVTTWMDLEGITLSEISQIETNKYNMISLVCGI